MSSIRTKWILELQDRISGPMRQLKQATAEAKNEAEQTQSRFKRLATVAGSFISAYAIMGGAKAMLQLGAHAETTEVKFSVLTGSMGNAKKLLDEINDFANRTPFDNDTLKQGAELMMNFGIAQEKVLPYMRMIGDVSGGNVEKFRSLTLAFAQVQSTGRLMGQDLLQMINAGFNPLQVISERTGRSMEQLKDDMAKGRISAEMVAQAFAAATGPGGRFHNMMEKVSQTAAGKFSTLMGLARSKLAEFSKNKLVPWLKKVLDAGIKLVNNFGKIYKLFKNLLTPVGTLIKSVFNLTGAILGLSGETDKGTSAFETFQSIMKKVTAVVEIISGGIQTLISIIKPFAPMIRIVGKAFLIATAAGWAFNIMLTANPVGLIIAGFVALAGTLKYAYNHFSKFRGIMDGAWAALKGFAGMIKNYVINRFKELLSGITGIGKALYYFFTGSWKKAWEAGKEGVKGLIGINSAKQAVADAKKLGEDVSVAYNRGVASIKYKGYKPEKGLAGIMSYKPGSKPKAKTELTPKTDFKFDFNTAGTSGGSQTGPKQSAVRVGSVGGATGGSGKQLTMNLNITNIFKMIDSSRQEIEKVAEQVVRVIVDKTRDEIITAG